MIQKRYKTIEQKLQYIKEYSKDQFETETEHNEYVESLTTSDNQEEVLRLVFETDDTVYNSAILLDIKWFREYQKEFKVI